MDNYLIFTFIVSAVFLFIYHDFVSPNRNEFYQNMLPEIFGLFVTYNIIEYAISRRKRREEQRRLTNLYQQIRRELFRILMNLRQISNYVEYIDDNFYGWARNNIKSINIIYPLLIAGNDLFSEYFYATLFRVLRDIELYMDYIIYTYPNQELTISKKLDFNRFRFLHNELANFMMTCEYDEFAEDIELIGESEK